MKRVAVFVVLLIIAAAGAGAWFYSGVDRPFKGYDGAEQFVEIPQGAGSIAIGAITGRSSAVAEYEK